MTKHNYRAREKRKQAEMMVREGRLEEARKLYFDITRSSSYDPEVWMMLSTVCRQLGYLEEAEQVARFMVAHTPDDVSGLHALGAALQRNNKLAEAIACYRNVLQIDPDVEESRYFLANALREAGAIDLAEEEYVRLLDKYPDHLYALNNLSALLTNRGRIQQASALLGRALKIAPDSPQLLINHGRACMHSGDAESAVASYRKVLALRPDMPDAHSNYLACLNYLAEAVPDEIFDAHCQWGEQHTDVLHSFTKWPNVPEPKRRLHVAYVSPDLCEHSVARFLQSVLCEHDHIKFEITCYADVPHPDAVTEKLRKLCDRWVDTSLLTHGQLAERIRIDQIDILIDLAGHTANNRLPMFALKPAPVQVSWLGYPNTTGVSAMDYRLTDARADPPGKADMLYTEQLVRLPDCFLSYHPSAEAPDVASLPMLAAGSVTFGSFNHLAKITLEVISAWSQILNAISGARLLLKSRATGDPGVRQRLQDLFSDQGVEAGQVIFLDSIPSFEGHMSVYNQVDIALDTFPYNGTTTTCEALWMGVPVITLAGEVHSARVGMSLLTSLGLENFIASDVENYVQLAVQFASQPERLASLRGGMRDKVAGSSLCDAQGLTRNIEDAYLGFWRRWCEGQ